MTNQEIDKAKESPFDEYDRRMEEQKTKARKKVLREAREDLELLVFDAVNLEGIKMSLPDVKKVIYEEEVSGYTDQELKITINQANAWRHLFSLVEQNKFSVSQEVACGLHAIAAKEEALEWGMFRSGQVTISGTDYCPPSAEQLPDLFSKMVGDYENQKGERDSDIFVFLTMARTQFFYDVNKRMGRLMMNGIRLSNGDPVISVPADEQDNFDSRMLMYYSTGDSFLMKFFFHVLEHIKTNPLLGNHDSVEQVPEQKHGTKRDGGTIKDWQVHDVSFTQEQIEAVYPGENLKPMVVSAIVVHDPQGRWIPGHHMKSSLIVKIDREKKILETRNTIYKLAGTEGADIFPNLGDDIIKIFY